MEISAGDVSLVLILFQLLFFGSISTSIIKINLFAYLQAADQRADLKSKITDLTFQLHFCSES